MAGGAVVREAHGTVEIEAPHEKQVLDERRDGLNVTFRRAVGAARGLVIAYPERSWNVGGRVDGQAARCNGLYERFLAPLGTGRDGHRAGPDRERLAAEVDCAVVLLHVRVQPVGTGEIVKLCLGDRVDTCAVAGRG